MIGQYFDDLTRSFANACFLVSRSGKIIRANALAAQMLGQDRNSLVGQAVTHLALTPEDKIARYLQHCLQSRDPVPGVLCWRAANHDQGIDCRCQGHRLVSIQEENEPVLLLRCEPKEVITNKFIALNQTLENLRLANHKLLLQSEQLAREIQEREVAQKKIAESHERLTVVLNGLDAIVYVTDMATYEILFLNQYALNIFGSIIGKVCWQTIQQGQSGPCEFCTNSQLLDAEGKPAGVCHWEFQNTKNGCWYDIRDRAIPWIDGRIVRMEIATDITERKKAEQQLEQKNAELERFTYTISHDLKSPIITIKGFLGTLVADAKAGKIERMESDIKRIGRAADKMQALLEDVLELSRIGRMVNPSVAFSMTEAALEAIEGLDGMIRAKGVAVTVEPNMPVVFADLHRIREVMQNLIENGVKYMGNQAEPRIEVGCRILDDGRQAYFVKDNGLGIESRFRDKIFGLFEKLDPHSEGTGIGLALVKRIIELHNGTIWVESPGPDQGTIFYFTLPQQTA